MAKSTDTDAARIDACIEKFTPEMAGRIRRVRSALRKRFPSANEIVYDNYNFFVIGYSATERPSDTLVSLAADANGVGISFYWGATIPDPHRLLQGSGKQNRFLRLPDLDLLADPRVQALFQAAEDQADPALPSSGKGKTILKSISAKQRPRRKIT